MIIEECEGDFLHCGNGPFSIGKETLNIWYRPLDRRLEKGSKF